MNHPSFPDLARRVRVHEIERASTYRQHYFKAQPKRRPWLAGILLFVCAAVLFGEIARYVEFMLR